MIGSENSSAQDRTESDYQSMSAEASFDNISYEEKPKNGRGRKKTPYDEYLSASYEKIKTWE